MSNIRYFTDEQKVENDARAQVARTASMPFVHGVAVMPDVHFGRGSTVGTVVATRGAIIPACVGVDIGCGMIAVRTSLTPAQVQPHLRTIREGIERRIPMGFGKNGTIHPSAAARVEQLEGRAYRDWADTNYMNRRSQDWRHQLGSLGGGNHFIEVCTGQELEPGTGGPEPHPPTLGPEEVWVILHSGSRGVGNKTGTFWTNVAKKQAKDYMYDGWLPDPDLAYLIENSEEYWQYMKELHWCQEFARLNREEMMDRVLRELNYTVLGGPELVPNGVLCPQAGCGTSGFDLVENPSIEVERINCHHNFVQKESYGGKNYSITRKGAIEARPGMKALIPGSMGARSYVVEGLGNEGAFNSAPHGAGRRMSRTQARKQFTSEGLAERMEGIEARLRPEILDEHPDAYKSIDQVMADAVDLVRPTHVLRQIVSVKGD